MGGFCADSVGGVAETGSSFVGEIEGLRDAGAAFAVTGEGFVIIEDAIEGVRDRFEVSGLLGVFSAEAAMAAAFARARSAVASLSSSSFARLSNARRRLSAISLC